MGAAVLAYFARPWSCGLALSLFDPAVPVPYLISIITAWA